MGPRNPRCCPACSQSDTLTGSKTKCPRAWLHWRVWLQSDTAVDPHPSTSGIDPKCWGLGDAGYGLLHKLLSGRIGGPSSSLGRSWTFGSVWKGWCGPYKPRFSVAQRVPLHSSQGVVLGLVDFLLSPKEGIPGKDCVQWESLEEILAKQMVFVQTKIWFCIGSGKPMQAAWCGEAASVSSHKARFHFPCCIEYAGTKPTDAGN